MVTSADQVERLLTTINNTVVANVYGDLAVAVAQGFLTGLAFWVLQRALPHHVGTADGCGLSGSSGRLSP
jgi:predicted PurR-regulated permease PerM